MIVAEAWKANYLYWLFPLFMIVALVAVLGFVCVLFIIRLYAQYSCGRFFNKTKLVVLPTLNSNSRLQIPNTFQTF